MSLSIKEKLRFLDRSTAEAKGNVPDRPAPLSESQLLPDCRIIENEYGRCVLREKKFPLSFQHGKTRLREFMDLPAKFFAFIGNNSSFDELDREGLLFLDTETTGLAGGTGTLIFLIGLGYFEDENFCVKQFLLLDISDEKAFLFEIEKFLAAKSCFVTFNGKSYDIPLLKSRFILNKIHSPTEQYSHIDLLHHCRRLWKKTAVSCSLSNIEGRVLGFQRQQDIPGSQIPETYFQFLRKRDINALIPILKHNAQDILSLVAIILQSYPIYCGETTSADMSWVLRVFCNLNDYDHAIRVKLPTESSNQSEEQQQFLLEKAKVYNRLQNYQKALEIFEHVQKNLYFNEISYVEAVKLLEHKFHSYKRALETLEKMGKRSSILAELRPQQYVALKDDLKKRKQRLLGKLAKLNRLDDA